MKTHSDELTLFVAVVEAGSFRQAAENLGMDNSVVSRGIKRLEEKLSTVLLNRTTRRVSLTEEGSWFYQRAVKILTEMSEAEGHLLMRREQPEGILRVDAATPFILHRLVPIIGEFRRRYPAIELQLHSSEGFINLMERRVDMAIRIGELTDSSLRALPLGRSRLRLLASPGYLSESGTPRQPADLLSGHELLGFLHPDHLNHWPLLSAEQGDRFAITPSLRASSGETLRQLALRGQGIVCLSDFMTGQDRESRALVEVLARNNSGASRPINAVFYSDAQRDIRLRVWLDFLKEQLGSHSL
ncbi:LysR substrate-binding domain-containing protein [Aeromonas allosaccharophila]|uniref:LysR substrate-binding domain-containing protein n=1 Tax=Aeromonas allosaccharophila TaxID=656 RepID=A0AAX3NSM2_9GAMM|nr:LysR substrate-binding domain-containing protein [Aeromonas allosaccharophila]WED75128.1 LysR substrate-binding domain-containing protein [Aeromonas allosaccharophila]